MSPTESLTSHDLQQFIDAHRIDAEILPMDGHTATVGDAARELGVETDQIIKSLVFMADGDPILVINNGLARVDRKKLADTIHLARKRVKFASADQALAITGFAVGAMPPFGHHRKLRTLVDAAITSRNTIFGGGGDIDAMMRLTTEELMRATAAELVEISE